MNRQTNKQNSMQTKDRQSTPNKKQKHDARRPKRKAKEDGKKRKLNVFVCHL